VPGTGPGWRPEGYEIRVRGRLGATFRAAFPGLRIRTQGHETVLTGPLADRAALHGMLAEIETLGLELVELRQLAPEPQLPQDAIRPQAASSEGGTGTLTHDTDHPRKLTRAELVARLVRAGELEVSGEHQAEVDSYFDQDKFRFHGPGGFETDYAGLTAYFASVRAAFDDRKITCGIIVAEGNTVACQTWIEGTFTREFTHSPAGPLPPNGARIVMDLINIFRFDGDGRLTEEYVRTDYRSLLRQLGAEGR
jgi:predicted ester cyclase